MSSMPDLAAISSTLAGPIFSVRSKNGTLSEATVASMRLQLGWQAAVLALRTGPALVPFTRPLAGNSFVGGESNFVSREMFWRSASARSYTLNEDPGGWAP